MFCVAVVLEGPQNSWWGDVGLDLILDKNTRFILSPLYKMSLKTNKKKKNEGFKIYLHFHLYSEKN